MTEAEKMNAYVWAARVQAGAVPLLHLSKGDKFVWAGLDLGRTKVYRGRGWYSHINGSKSGKCFRSGVKTAVIQVKE